MKRVIAVMLSVSMLFLYGCGGRQEVFSLEGKTFNTEKVDQLTEEQQAVVQEYIEQMVCLYNQTDFSEPLPVGFYFDPINGEEKSPNDINNEIADFEFMVNYSTAKQLGQEPIEEDSEKRRQLEALSGIWRGVNSIVDVLYAEVGDEYKVDKKAWKALEQGIEEAIEYYYIEEE